jgi:hypothetical protein
MMVDGAIRASCAAFVGVHRFALEYIAYEIWRQSGDLDRGGLPGFSNGYVICLNRKPIAY